MTDGFFTSLVHVIAHPERYHDKLIKLIGFCSLKFEGKAIYLSESDYVYGVTKNGIWLSAELSDNNMKLHNNYIIVVGTFDMNYQGHLEGYFGSLTNLTRLELWEELRK